MITFATAEVAQRCIEMYNGQPFPGGDRPMTISIAKFKPMDPSARGGAGGGFRGGRGGGGGRGGFGELDLAGYSQNFIYLFIYLFECTLWCAFEQK
ncbi:hypothetical protein Y032_0281g1243 [Ancylostoma ceylanicum]|uniref:RRM domain-containing protein n=1 Tax=Ancylostoma ceylanicum TaxID=53326 RepID=A0A016S6P3_9BILA|nr:hypothetical protein Y032_0281g1243 [Ancylostoma ceylanicum]